MRSNGATSNNTHGRATIFEPNTRFYQTLSKRQGTPGHYSSLCNRFRGFFAQILPASRGRCVPSTVCALRKQGSQLLLWAANYFFLHFFTCKSAYSCVKTTVMCTVPRPQSCYFAFSHRAQGKLGLRFSALSKAVIIFKFCTQLGPTGTKKMTCASARNNVLMPIYGGADVPGPESINASVSRSTLLITPKLALICSMG